MLSQQQVDQIWEDAVLLQEYFFSITPQARQSLIKAAYALKQIYPVLPSLEEYCSQYLAGATLLH